MLPPSCRLRLVVSVPRRRRLIALPTQTIYRHDCVVPTQLRWSTQSTSTTSTPILSPKEETRTITSAAAGLPLENVDVSSSDTNTVPIKAYSDLAKARLSALVVGTTAAGFVAAGGPISWPVAASCVVGTALCSSSAAGWNQILEVDRDKRMKRTQQRPLVKGTLSVPHASLAATTWGVMGVSLLSFGTDPVTAALGAGNMFLYAGVYTHLKPRSVWNTWVGAVVGAVPPVMGWTAATGGSLFDIEAMLLGSILYCWQMPHFFALGFMHRVDYKRGGFVMLPVVDEPQTAEVITRYAWYLATIPMIATVTGVTGNMFAIEGIALNAYAIHVAHQFQREQTNANAQKVFLTSLWYLPCLLMLFLLHSKIWDEEEQKQQQQPSLLSEYIHVIRDKGRQICLHEQAAASSSSAVAAAACPVTIAKRVSRDSVDVMESAKTAATANGTLEAE